MRVYPVIVIIGVCRNYAGIMRDLFYEKILFVYIIEPGLGKFCFFFNFLNFFLLFSF